MLRYPKITMDAKHLACKPSSSPGNNNKYAEGKTSPRDQSFKDKGNHSFVASLEISPTHLFLTEALTATLKVGCWGVHVRSSKCSLFADTNCGIVRCCASRIFPIPFLLLFLLRPMLLDNQNQHHGRKNLLTQARSSGPFWMLLRSGCF